MSKKQKIIKYFATALAILLAVGIIGGIAIGILALTGNTIFVRNKQENVVIDNTDNYTRDYDDSYNTDYDDSYDSIYGNGIHKNEHSGIKRKDHVSGHSYELSASDFSDRSYLFQNISEIKDFEIDASFYTVYFSEGDSDRIKVELHQVYNGYTVEKDGSTLKLEEDDSIRNYGFDGLFDFLDHGVSAFHHDNTDSYIMITVPRGFNIGSIELDSGAGNIYLDDLTAKELDIDAGAGNIHGTSITAGSVSLDGGAGNIEFKKSSFGGMDIDAGVGNIDFQGGLSGHSTISCGVGNINFSLNDPRNAYSLSLEKGLGTIRLDGKKMNFESNYAENSNASCSLDISGGVGNITIDFAD